MQPDALLPPSLPPPVGALTFDKVRFRFRKVPTCACSAITTCCAPSNDCSAGPICPVRRTQGFHPHPRLVFALSLPLGVVGHEEVGELELDTIPLSSTKSAIAWPVRSAGAGDSVVAPYRSARASAQVRRLTYRLCRAPGSLPGSGRKTARRRWRLPSVAWSATSRNARVWTFARFSVNSAWSQTATFIFLTFVAQAPLVMVRAKKMMPLLSRHDLVADPGRDSPPAEVLRVLGLEDLLADGAVLERTRSSFMTKSSRPPMDAVP